MSQGRHSVMRLESTATMSNPTGGLHTVLITERPAAQVKHTDTRLNQDPTTPRDVFNPEMCLHFCRYVRILDVCDHLLYAVLLQVEVEALFSQKPSTTVKVFIIVVSLVLGLMILAALIWCLWKVS